MKSELERIATVELLKSKAIISLISNVQQSSAVLEKVWLTSNPVQLATFECRMGMVVCSELGLGKMRGWIGIWELNVGHTRRTSACIWSNDALYQITDFVMCSSLLQVFRVFKKNEINVQMISQGASKVWKYLIANFWTTSIYMTPWYFLQTLNEYLLRDVNTWCVDSCMKKCGQSVHSIFIM